MFYKNISEAYCLWGTESPKWVDKEPVLNNHLNIVDLIDLRQRTVVDTSESNMEGDQLFSQVLGLNCNSQTLTFF